MSSIAWWLVVIVAVLHVGFMCIEMFRWEIVSQRAAGLDPATAEKTKALGFNQGLYNGFLAAGLAWALFAPPLFSARLALFFLGCVLVAGLVGGCTIKPPNRNILVAQALPAALGLIALWLT